MSKANENVYNLTEAPEWMAHTADRKPGDAPHWSGRATDGLTCPPSIGMSVWARGDLGFGKVVGYFVEFGYLGVELRLTDPPSWWMKQNWPNAKARLFGAELRGYSATTKTITADNVAALKAAATRLRAPCCNRDDRKEVADVLDAIAGEGS